MKKKMVVWIQNDCKYITCLFSRLYGWIGAVAYWYLALWESIELRIPSLRKYKHSKCEVWFLLNEYCFCTVINLKNYKSETLCVLSCFSRVWLWDPVDGSPLGSSVHGILQARILGWAAISFFRDLPDPGIEPASPALQADSLPLSHQGSPCIVQSYSN